MKAKIFLLFTMLVASRAFAGSPGKLEPDTEVTVAAGCTSIGDNVVSVFYQPTEGQLLVKNQYPKQQEILNSGTKLTEIRISNSMNLPIQLIGEEGFEATYSALAVAGQNRILLYGNGQGRIPTTFQCEFLNSAFAPNPAKAFDP